jgi:hypothetical protein
MDTARSRRSIFVTLGALTIAVIVPLPFSSAECGQPYLDGFAAKESRVVKIGSTIDVDGFAFFASDCHDTPGTLLTSCFDAEPVAYEDVQLSLRQGKHFWRLGVSHAESDRAGHLTWHVELPADLQPGEATLEAHIPSPDRVDVTVRVEH